jgi:hypothetical protein
MTESVLISSTEREFSAHNDPTLLLGDWDLHKTETMGFVETFSSPNFPKINLLA